MKQAIINSTAGFLVLAMFFTAEGSKRQEGELPALQNCPQVKKPTDGGPVKNITDDETGYGFNYGAYVQSGQVGLFY